MKPVQVTLFQTNSNNPQAPDYNCIVRMDDNSEYKCGIWPREKKDRDTGEWVPVIDPKTNLQVLGGKIKDEDQRDSSGGSPRQAQRNPAPKPDPSAFDF
jgi:hypothetical protein